MSHDYFYGRQADRFSFIKFPKALIYDSTYAGLSAEGKILYAAFLDRMSLSIRNDWMDDDGRIYIVFSQSAIMTLLSCQTGKASKVMKELEAYDLIRKVRVGQGKTDRIYVLNFESDDTDVTDDYADSTEAFNDDFSEMRKSHFKKCENRTLIRIIII